MVYTFTAAASSQAEQPSLHLSTSSDVSIDILADLDTPDSAEELHLLFQSDGFGSSQAAVEHMFIDSTRSAAGTTMPDLTFDPIDQHDDDAFDLSSRRNSLYLNDLGFATSISNGRAPHRSSLANESRSRRDRSPAAKRPRKRISVKDVDFDPTPSRHDDDISPCSFNMAHTSQVAAVPLNTSSSSFLNPDEQPYYNSALASLVQSMQRTEQSRRHVMLQISLLTPNQRLALEEARHQQLQAIQTEALISVQTPTSTRELSPTRSSSIHAGSRGTLTNGLEEQSRRQERNYMGQIRNHSP